MTTVGEMLWDTQMAGSSGAVTLWKIAMYSKRDVAAGLPLSSSVCSDLLHQFGAVAPITARS
jgi:hypothetical protein